MPSGRLFGLAYRHGARCAIIVLFFGDRAGRWILLEISSGSGGSPFLGYNIIVMGVLLIVCLAVEVIWKQPYCTLAILLNSKDIKRRHNENQIPSYR